ncbi:putative ATP-dependent RNA helicase dhx33 [Terramyces sp. JEL0728]|nr:putative ATP-dependent RNA helicase dhx33 [Terramyces sp. JEL0728]
MPKVKNAKKQNKSNLEELRRQAQQLPIYQSKDMILEHIKQNQTTVLVGETGSGKTTQIPQFLFGVTKKCIAITQPRRVAAISIAQRVADEMDCKLGTTVGFTIRFQDQTNPHTRIKYMTDGMLLRELLNDSQLSRYSIIILDEAHERTLRTDILFGAIKGIMKQRKDLKLVIMSATMNAEAFAGYFSAEIINIPGRQFPVSIYYAPEKLADYLDSALTTVFQIHTKQPKGDILVFLTGQEEIENLETLIGERAKTLPGDVDQLLVCPIFGNQSSTQQTQIFAPTPPGMRKVVIATNIAETSITISGIKYVVDSGMVKIKGFNPKTGIETLSVQPISKAAANQRSGRAGRESSGTCYRLYPEKLFNELEAETQPEIKRSNLANVILLLKASGIDDIVGFDFMDKPSRQALVGALEQLFALGALNDQGELTDIGRQMSWFPTDPTFAKKYKCTKEAIDLISMLSVDSLFFSPTDKRDEAQASKKIFMSYEGDHITLLNVMKAYESTKGDAQWCHDHFISARSMKNIMDIRKQLLSFASQQNIDTSASCGQDYESLIKCLLSGFFKNVAIRQHDGTFKTLLTREIVYIHPTSVLFQTKQPAIMFSECVKTTRQYLKNVSVIQPSWLSECIYPESKYKATNNAELTERLNLLEEMLISTASQGFEIANIQSTDTLLNDISEESKNYLFNTNRDYLVDYALLVLNSRFIYMEDTFIRKQVDCIQPLRFIMYGLGSIMARPEMVPADIKGRNEMSLIYLNKSLSYFPSLAAAPSPGTVLTFLMITLAYSRLDRVRDSIKYLGMSITIAKQIGLNNEIRLQKLSAFIHEREQFRALWWYIHDIDRYFVHKSLHHLKDEDNQVFLPALPKKLADELAEEVPSPYFACEVMQSNEWFTPGVSNQSIHAYRILLSRIFTKVQRYRYLFHNDELEDQELVTVALENSLNSWKLSLPDYITAHINLAASMQPITNPEETWLIIHTLIHFNFTKVLLYNTRMLIYIVESIESAIFSNEFIESVKAGHNTAQLLTCYLTRNPKFEYSTLQIFPLMLLHIPIALICASKMNLDFHEKQQILQSLEVIRQSLYRHTLTYERVPALLEAFDYFMQLNDPVAVVMAYAEFQWHDGKIPKMIKNLDVHPAHAIITK